MVFSGDLCRDVEGGVEYGNGDRGLSGLYSVFIYLFKFHQHILLLVMCFN